MSWISSESFNVKEFTVQNHFLHDSAPLLLVQSGLSSNGNTFAGALSRKAKTNNELWGGADANLSEIGRSRRPCIFHINISQQ